MANEASESLVTAMTRYAFLIPIPILAILGSSGEILTVKQVLSDPTFFASKPAAVRAAFVRGGHGHYIQDLADFGTSNRYQGKFSNASALLIEWRHVLGPDGYLRHHPSIEETVKTLSRLAIESYESRDRLVVATFEGTVERKKGFRFLRPSRRGDIVGGTGFGHLGFFQGKITVSAIKDIELTKLPIQ